MVAHKFHKDRFVRRLYGYWVQYWQIEINKTAAGNRRAMAFYESSLIDRGLHALHFSATLARAERFHRKNTLTKFFLSWAGVATDADLGGRAGSQLIQHVVKSELTVSVDELQAALAKELEASKAAAFAAKHTREMGAYMTEATSAAERAHWARTRAETNHIKIQKKLGERQEQERQRWRKQQKVDAMAAFQEASRDEVSVRHFTPIHCRGVSPLQSDNRELRGAHSFQSLRWT